MKIHHRRMTQLVTLTCIGMLAGCGNIATVKSFSTSYQEASSGEIAQLRVISNGMVRAVPGRECVNWRSEGAGVMIVPKKGFADLNDHDLHMPESDLMLSHTGVGVARSELRVAANVPITLDFLGSGWFSASGATRYFCKKSLSFVPQSGENYEAVFLESGACSISVRQLSSDKNKAASQIVPIKNADFCNLTDKFS